MFAIIQNIIGKGLENITGLSAAFFAIVLPVYVKASDALSKSNIDRIYDLVVIPIPWFPITGLHISFVMGFLYFFIMLWRLSIKARSEELDLRRKEKDLDAD